MLRVGCPIAARPAKRTLSRSALLDKLLPAAEPLGPPDSANPDIVMTEHSPTTSAAPWQSPTLSLDGRVAIVAGAGQTPGPVIGNGRATCVLFARAGAHVIALDRDQASAQETVAMIEANGGDGEAMVADVTEEAALSDVVQTIVERHGRIDVLQNNVGVAYTGGDSPLADLDEASFDRVMAINLRGTVMACKHMVPVMRGQESGVITNISSIAAVVDYKSVTYKTSKAGMIAFSRQLALDCAADGVRVNAILPGYMDTPMAVDTQARRSGRPREEIAATRDTWTPLKGGMGSAWDVAQASLFLASDAARFITGVALPVDGGVMARVG